VRIQDSRAHHIRINHDSHADLRRERTARISASIAEASVRSAPRHAACFAQTRERQLCLPLADGAGRFFKLIFLNSEEDRDRVAVCRQHQIVFLAGLRTYPDR
jgi:hypothetical protein